MLSFKILVFLVVFLIIPFESYGDNLDFCRKKVIDSQTFKDGILQLPIDKHTRLIFSRTPPKQKILKFDPFLSLYLVEDKKGFRYPFVISRRYSLNLASISSKSVVKGKISTKQRGLDHFATFDKSIISPAVLLNSCCALEGIVTSMGIIEKEYIDRFVHSKNVSYGDLGVRFKQTALGVVVDKVKLYNDKNSFLKGDIILSFDGKKVQNDIDLQRWILFSQIGKIYNIKLKRDSKTINLKVKIQKRYGGGYLSDTSLEPFGFYFDNNLKLIRLDAKAKKYQLKLGDKLLKIYAQKDGIVKLLFRRAGFDFFIYLKVDKYF